MSAEKSRIADLERKLAIVEGDLAQLSEVIAGIGISVMELQGDIALHQLIPVICCDDCSRDSLKGGDCKPTKRATKELPGCTGFRPTTKPTDR